MMNRLPAMIGGVAVTCLSAGCMGTIGGTDKNERLPADRPIVLAMHRGDSDLAENTLPSFETAWQLGAVPEVDARTTADGVLVALGDATIDRVARAAAPELHSKRAGDLNWAEIARLDIGSRENGSSTGPHVPRLEDVFTAMGGGSNRWAYINARDVLLEDLANLVRQHHVQRQIIVTSTDESILRRWKELLPDGRTLVRLSGNEARLKHRLSQLKESQFAGITQIQIEVIAGDLRDEDPFAPSSAFLKSTAQDLREKGVLLQILPRKQSGFALYDKLADLGVRSFASNEPAVALRALVNHLH